MPDCTVKLFALSTCVHCRHTREFLESNNIVFTCVYVDKLEGDERQQAIEQVRGVNPRVSFPTMVLNEHDVIVGFKKDDIIKALHL